MENRELEFRNSMKWFDTKSQDERHKLCLKYYGHEGYTAIYPEHINYIHKKEIKTEHPQATTNSVEGKQGEKLELRHVAPYFQHDLLCQTKSVDGLENGYLTAITNTSKDGYIATIDSSDYYFDSDENYFTFKPILRPLSDLTKEIELSGKKFVPIDYFEENYTDHKVKFEKPDYIVLYEEYSLEQNVLGAPFAIIEKLFEWHFDVFSLIEKGLAIDINTLNL